jgi:glucose/arabinose dehydrogenase
MGMGRRVVTLAAFAVGVVLVVGIGGAVTCKVTDLNCHLRNAPEWRLSEVEGQRGGTRTLNSTLTTRRIAGGLDYPTDFDFLPDGRMIVALRTGLIEIVDHGRVPPKPVLDLRGRVSTWGLRGVMAVVVDPVRTAPIQFYVAYSVIDPRYPDPSSGKPTTFRVSRFTMVHDVASVKSERIIVGHVTGGSCVSHPTSDCLPADRDHIGADILPRPDGTLLISTGDGGPAQDNVELAQDVDSLGGKILRVDRSGRGVKGNPFWNGNAEANRSKVWAYGLRNPFRLSALSDGEVVVGDVGFNDVEELDLVHTGGDYGWPCLEGATKTPAFRSSAFCAAYYAKHKDRSLAPWFALPHPAWRTVIAGASLHDAKELPRSFRSKYVLADWAVSKLWVADASTSRDHLRSPSELHIVETGTAGPVRLRVGPDGALYELAINTGEIWRIAAVER